MLMKLKTSKKKAPAASGVQAKFAGARRAYEDALVERDDEAVLTLTALIAGEHLLLVGDPGTSKSLLVASLVDWVDGARQCTVHCCKDTSRNMAFGPVDLQTLKERVQKRVLDGGAADAHFLILEEIFKAGPAVLDMFLMLLNERVYKEGVFQATAPLRLALGVSNEWSPDGCETALAAFFDRFLFRKGVAPVGQRGLRRLLEKARAGDACRPAFPDKITLAEVDQAHAEAMALPVTNGAQKAMWDIQIELRHEKIQPSDRRTMKAYKAARAYAYLCGARGVIASDGVTVLDGVRAEHLEILRHVLWAAPEQAKKCATVVMKHSNPTGSRVTELLTQADDKVDSLTGLRGEQLKHQAAVVVAALEGVAGQLDALPPDPRVSAALAYVRGQVDTVRPQVLGMAPAEG